VKKIGLIGLGYIGSFYLKKLREAGYPLTVHLRNPQKLEVVVELGAIPVDTVEKVVQNSDFIILSLPNTEVVELVMEGDGGVLSVLKEGQMVIDTSTSRPKTAIRLEKLCEEKGANFIDSPLSWRRPAGQLLMVGGKEASFKKAEEILKCLSYKYSLIGPIGSGQILKMINQGLLAIKMAAHCEAVELAKKYGLAPMLLKKFLEFDIHESLILENYNGNGELIQIYKDLGYLLEMAHESCANIPISSFVHEIFKSTKVYGESKWTQIGIQTYYNRLNNEKHKY
jgi:3-hydroxyisobutyrate dehydrogenase-like beta-hydroxyacid dehydrogenase